MASDSSFNDNKDSSKSTVGWGLWLGDKCNGMIQWTSKVPKTVATSSTNAEVQAAIGLAKDTPWIRTLLDEWSAKKGVLLCTKITNQLSNRLETLREQPCQNIT